MTNLLCVEHNCIEASTSRLQHLPGTVVVALSLHPRSAACACPNPPAVPPSPQALPSGGSASGDVNQEESEVNSILYKG